MTTGPRSARCAADNEITSPNAIALALGQGHFTAVELGSVQAGETGLICGSNDGLAFAQLGSGTGTGAIVNDDSSLLAGYSVIVVADPFLMNQGVGNSNNVVLMSVTTVPEPGALALLAAGLLGAALVAGRRRVRPY